MEILKHLLSEAKLIAEAFLIYIKKLEYSGFSGVDPLESDRCYRTMNYVMESPEPLKILEEFFNKPTLALAFKLNNTMNDIVHNIKLTWKTIKKSHIPVYQQSGTKHLSSGYLTDLNNTYNMVKNNYLDFKIQDYHKIEPTITDELLHAVPITEVMVEEAKQLYQDSIQNSPININFYIYLLQTIINKVAGTIEGKSIIKLIIKDVEESKTQSLSKWKKQEVTKNVDKYPITNSNIIQRLSQRFSLVVDGPDRPLIELLRQIGYNDKSENLLAHAADILSAQSRTDKYGFIMIYNQIAKPIYYNPFLLLNFHPEEGQTNLGICKKVQQQTELIKYLPSNSPKSEILFFDDHFIPTTNNYYYIIESIAEGYYHLLVPWNCSSFPYSESTTPKLIHKYIPALWVEPIKSADKTPSHRVAYYNSITNEEIIKRRNKPFVEAAILSRSETKREETYWKNIRSKIVAELIQWLRNEILNGNIGKHRDKKRENKIAFTDITGILIRHLPNELTTAITDQIIPEFNSTDPIIIAQIKAELFVSYYKDLDKIKKNFTSDIVNTCNEAKGEIEQLLKRNEQEKVITIIARIFEKTLEYYINRRSNIFITIDRKLELLNKTLCQI